MKNGMKKAEKRAEPDADLRSLFDDVDLEEDAGAGETAIEYTDQFMHAAVVRIDAIFGDGFARLNPALVGAYVQASAANLSAFMTSAMAMAQLEAANSSLLRRR